MVSRAWERIQNYKLEQLKAVIRPAAQDEMVRSELRNTSIAVLGQVTAMRAQMDQLWSQMKVQTLALNKLCRRNGFATDDNRTSYQL